MAAPLRRVVRQSNDKPNGESVMSQFRVEYLECGHYTLVDASKPIARRRRCKRCTEKK